MKSLANSWLISKSQANDDEKQSPAKTVSPPSVDPGEDSWVSTEGDSKAKSSVRSWRSKNGSVTVKSE